MKFIQSYKQVLKDAQMLSKISSFLIAVFVFLELGDLLYALFFKASEGWINVNWNSIFTILIFLVLLGSVFAIRFIFLYLRRNNFLWLSQICWIFGWLTILAYKLVTAKILFGSFFGSREFPCMDCFYFETFLGASYYLVLMLLAYLFLSPIKQIICLAIPLLYRK